MLILLRLMTGFHFFTSGVLSIKDKEKANFWALFLVDGCDSFYSCIENSTLPGPLVSSLFD